MGQDYRFLECSYAQKDGVRSCDLPVVQAGAAGLIVVNRHRGERHMNQVPYEWVLEQMAATESGRKILQKWLDKQKTIAY